MATPAERLVEAEAALHALNIGKAVVRVTDSNGDSVAYNTGNARNLVAYIAALKAEIAGTTIQRGPMRPMFLL